MLDTYSSSVSSNTGVVFRSGEGQTSSFVSHVSLMERNRVGSARVGAGGMETEKSGEVWGSTMRKWIGDAHLSSRALVDQAVFSVRKQTEVIERYLQPGQQKHREE